MARIPDYTAVEARGAQTRTPQFDDQSAQIAGRAAEGLVRTIGGAADRVIEHDDKINYARARSMVLQADVEAKSELENDQDYETFEKRYNERMSKARDEATKLIRGKDSKSLFDMDAKLDIARGTAGIRAEARRKEVDVNRGNLDQTLNANRAAALNAKDEPTRAALISATNEMIDGAIQKGYVRAEEGVALRQNWTTGYAEGFVSMQPADKRIEMLSTDKGVAAHIAPDKRVAMLDAAKRESRSLNNRRQSQVFEDALVGKYGANQTALAKAREITDPEVRDETVDRVKVRIAEAKAAEVEAQSEVNDQAIEFINGGGKFADLPIKIKNSLKPSTLTSLRSYAEQLAKPTPVVTDKPTYIDLSSKFADDPQGFGEVNLLDYRDKLDNTDFEKMADLQRKVKSGNIDGKASGFQSITQIRDDRLREVFGSTKAKGAKQEKINSFVSQFESRLAAFKDETGKQARAADAKSILDDMTTEVAINWGSDKKAFELTDKDLGVPQQDRDLIISGLRKRGLAVTDENIQRAYAAANKKPKTDILKQADAIVEGYLK